MKPLSWKAVRNGAIYCAPACGCKCTKAEYDNARKQAAALAAKMGKGWKPRVWENMGWHYCAMSACGAVKLHPIDHQGRTFGYHAFFGEGIGGRWVEHGRTPHVALMKVLRKARAELRMIRTALTPFGMAK